MEFDGFQNYTKLTTICRSISENPNDLQLLEKLNNIIRESPKSFIKAAHKILLGSFYPYMKTVSSDNGSFSCQGKQTLVEALTELLDKLAIENNTVFFNFYSFLLFELYDYSKHQVLPNTEEYKSALLKCMISLIKSISLSTLEELYVKENVPKFSQIIYVCGELAKNEKSRDLRCAAITCIMALAKVMDSDDFGDVVLRDRCAQMFMFFLPGLSTTFSEIALEDLKTGHRVPMMSIRAFGRIIALVMQDYNPADEKVDIKELLMQNQHFSTTKAKWKDKKDIDQYLDTTTRSIQWYKLNDDKLDVCLKKFATLTHHSHINVRLELVNMASNIMRNCISTMSRSMCTLIEILIILSQDEEVSISNTSNELIDNLSSRLSSDNLRLVFESLEEGFYSAVNSLPRRFNSIDDAEKISALNLLIGYIRLFGQHRLNDVLLSPTTLHKLVHSLLHVSELEKTNISLLEEYTLKDLSVEPNFRSSWINFHYFKDEAIKTKIETLCVELARNNCCEIIYDSLIDTFLYESDHKKEALYLINAHILGFNIGDPDHEALLKNILDLYTDQSYNDTQSALDSDEYTSEEIQNNVIVLCLLTEGVAKVSMVLKEKFERYLLKSLYLVLERAGSGHPLIRAAGLLALKILTHSCGYSEITDLINSNFSFFSFHVERKLTKAEDKEGVLNVLSVVLKYSDKSVLLPMSNIVEEILLQSCDRFKQKYATAYLKTFEMFILSLRRWFEIKVVIEPMKSKSQKEREYEDFKVTGINYNDDFSDDIMEGKTAEEMYKEDMEKKTKSEGLEEKEQEEYKKPEPPLHIKLTSSILRRSLHFLPSKNQERKILVLNILEAGIEILRDWEDELLPVVHQIWSPLVQRFKEEMSPLTFILSLRVLKTLGRLSKDFIKMRTTKDVLPSVKEYLATSATVSYRKDKGSAYRYSLNYKLQAEMLKSLSPILYYIDADANIIGNMMESISLYLSDKQPQELQAAAVEFYKEMAEYDLKMVEENLAKLQETVREEYEKNLERIEKYCKKLKPDKIKNI